MHQKHPQQSNPRRRTTVRDRRTARSTNHARDPDCARDALDLAARIAEPYPEEAEAIERVTRFVRGHAAGEPLRSDVLLALSILITAVDHDSTEEQQALFTLLDTLLAGSPRSAAASNPTVLPYVSRAAVPRPSRPLAHRCAPARPLSTLSTHLAA